MTLPFLFDGSGKAALLLSSMTLHDLCSSSPCTVPLPAQSRKPAAMGERLGPGRLPGSIFSGPTFIHCDWILRLQEDWSRIVDCCGTGGKRGTTWHVCDGLIGIIRAARLPGWDTLKRLD